MKGITKWRLTALMALMVAVGMLVGCAQKVGDIDRTQPNLIAKQQFQTDDEWYIQQTIVDTDMQGSVFFKAFESPLKRVRWTVTETVLYAHSTVELAEGLLDGFDDEESRRLGVVAAFPIRGHFDVQRSYNAATGEPGNVIMENASDRPWYDRDYMRVDWSTNLVDGFWMIQGFLGSMAPIRYNYPQQDGYVHPNRTRISDDYIDTVTEYSYAPDIMACYGAYGYDTIFSCEGGRLSVRNSIMRVPEEETYIPMNYTDTMEITREGDLYGTPMYTASIYDPQLGYEVEVECREEVRSWMLERFGSHWEERCRRAKFDLHARFGYFRTERVTWDRFVGTSDDQRRYYVNRWNIWQSMLDENGEPLAFEDRIPQPITFYLNLEYPEFMFEAAQITAHEWDIAFRGAVKIAMGIDDAQLDEILEEHYGHTQMYRIVENSCHPGPLVEWRNEHGYDHAEDRQSVSGIFSNYIGSISDDAAMEQALWDLSNQARTNLCAELEFATETRPVVEDQFTWERVGDMRYSFFNWVEESVPWAGYGPSAADPLTGEIIRGAANFAGAYIRRISTYAADLIQYFNGELSDEHIMAGVQIRRDLFEDSDSASQRFGLNPEGRQELARRSGVNPDDATRTNFTGPLDVADLDEMILSYGPERIQQEADIASIAGHERQSNDGRMVEFLNRPEVKHFLMGDIETQMAVRATAMERHGPSFDIHQEHQAYLDFHTPRLLNERTTQRDRMLMERNIMTVDGLAQMAEGLVTYRGVADYFRGMPRADIIEYFMNKMFIGTQLHEIGHTVGLRHNFSASTDALNYHDEYWLIELAVVEGRITREEAYSIQGDLISEVTDRDVDYLSQSEFQLASVMDYTGDLTGRFQGLAKYDLAAINFAYGESVEQWRPDVNLPNLLSYDTWLRDYKELPLIFAHDYSGDEAAAYAAGIEIMLNGRHYVPISAAMEERRQGILTNTDNWISYDFDGAEPHINRAVAYEFCSDEFRGRVLNCAIWDFGANQTEIVNHSFDTFRALQTFWRYRRHSISRNYENLSSYVNRLFNTFQTTQEPFRYYSFYRWYDLGDYTDDLLGAAVDAFNFYNEIMAMPEPGRFCLYDSSRSSIDVNWFHNLENTYVPARFHADRGNCDGYVDIPKGTGQLYNYSFTNEYSYRIDRVGSFIDKLIAAQMIFDISANFAQGAFVTDFRATNLTYWTVFKDEMLDMLRGVILGDYSAYGGVMDQGEYVAPQPIHAETFGQALVQNPQNGQPRIYTPQSINHEFNMLVGGLIYNADWGDREIDFSHYIKIAVTGIEDQPFADGAPVLEFVHPVTYQVYSTVDIEERTIAAELINRANYLGDRFLQADELYQQTQPGASNYNQLRATRDHRLEQVQDVVAKMDMIRFVFGALGPNALR